MDIDKMVDAVTKMIMERLNASSGAGGRIVAFGDVPADLLPDCELRRGVSCEDIGDCDYIIMTVERFREIHGSQAKACEQPRSGLPVSGANGMRAIDLSGKRLIHERDLRDHNAQNGDVVIVDKNAIITALAHDYAKSIGAKIQRE